MYSKYDYAPASGFAEIHPSYLGWKFIFLLIISVVRRSALTSDRQCSICENIYYLAHTLPIHRYSLLMYMCIRYECT